MGGKKKLERRKTLSRMTDYSLRRQQEEEEEEERDILLANNQPVACSIKQTNKHMRKEKSSLLRKISWFCFLYLPSSAKIARGIDAANPPVGVLPLHAPDSAFESIPLITLYIEPPIIVLSETARA